MSEVRVIKGTRERDGDCCFCNRERYQVVFVIRGNGTRVQLCEECIRVVKKFRFQG